MGSMMAMAAALSSCMRCKPCAEQRVQPVPVSKYAKEGNTRTSGVQTVQQSARATTGQYTYTTAGQSAQPILQTERPCDCSSYGRSSTVHVQRPVYTGPMYIPCSTPVRPGNMETVIQSGYRPMVVPGYNIYGRFYSRCCW